MNPVESYPWPPNSHRFPASSIQDEDSARPLGTLPAAGTPFVPYTPWALTLFAPLIQVQCHAAPTEIGAEVEDLACPTVSLAMIVWLLLETPNVTENVPVPFESIASGGSLAEASELVMCTVPT